MEPKKILLVDDEADILESLGFALEADGYKIVTATDGHQAYGAARFEEPDLMVLDVMMPRKNGYEVARRLSEDAKHDPRYKRCPIIMLTARKVDSSEREDFLETWSGADLHIFKPFELAEVIAGVKTLLGDD
ncbi:MAG: response regulator transcription factor [Myxococcota bacterium]